MTAIDIETMPHAVHRRGFFELAGGLGFEPRPAESESAVFEAFLTR